MKTPTECIHQQRRRWLSAAASLALLQACHMSTTASLLSGLALPEPTAANRLAVFAPSGFGLDDSRLHLGLSRLVQAGFYPENLRATQRRYARFAGSDSERAKDFQQLIHTQQPMPKILMALRGGSGAMHVLPLVDWQTLGEKIKAQQTILIGMSDITVISAALLAKAGCVTFSGPMLYSHFGADTLSALTMDHFARHLSQPQISITVADPDADNGDYQGIFWGGNLSVLSTLVGTPYFPKIEGGILYLEDTGEAPYRIDRMLNQLALSGCLNAQQALVLGDFRTPQPDIYDANYDINAVFARWQDRLHMPIYRHFPSGHIDDITTVPLGGMAHLRANNTGYVLHFANHPTLDSRKLRLDVLTELARPNDFLPLIRI